MTTQDGTLKPIDDPSELKIGDVLRLMNEDKETNELSSSPFSDVVVTNIAGPKDSLEFTMVRPHVMVRSIGISHTPYVALETLDLVPASRLRIFRRVMSSRNQPMNVDHQ